MLLLEDALRAVAAAGLSRADRCAAFRIAIEHYAGHAGVSQQDQLQSRPQTSCEEEVEVRLDAVRPALQALIDGRQPSGAQRRRRNNALHLAAGGRRLGCDSG